ncbi:MAG: sialidase family protein [Gaiellales bacterium]
MSIPAPAPAAAPFGGSIVRVNQVTTSSQNETTVAINPTDPRNLVAGSITFETGTGQCAAFASSDRGNTWTHQVLPNAPGQTPGGAPLVTAAGDPVVASDAIGTAYYLCMELIPGPRTQYLWRSTDGGQTWVGPALAMGSPGTTDDDKGHLAVDEHPSSPHAGNVYAAATSSPCGAGDLRFARSTTGGTSFQPDQKVNDAAAIAFAGNIAVAADGAVYVAWRQMTPCGATQSTAGIMMDKSVDGGQSFGALTGGTDRPVRLGPIVAGASRLRKRQRESRPRNPPDGSEHRLRAVGRGPFRHRRLRRLLRPLVRRREQLVGADPSERRRESRRGVLQPVLAHDGR